MNNFGTLKTATHQSYLIYRYTLVAWTVIISGSFGWFYYQEHNNLFEISRSQARSALESGSLYRLWVSRRGGIYAASDTQTPPNKLLSHVPERDITTPSGKKLTLVNAAYLARLVHEFADHENVSTPGETASLHGHLTSLKPIRPENIPDAWEQKSLKQFEQGVMETSAIEEMNGIQYMRVMRASVMTDNCLKCHPDSQPGSVRGGVSFSLPLTQQIQSTRTRVWNGAATHGMIWLFGLGMIGYGKRKIIDSTAMLENNAEQSRILLESSQAGIIMISPEGFITRANNRMAEMFGCSMGTLVGSRYADHVHQEHLRTLDDQIHKLKTGVIDRVASERRYLRTDGSDFLGFVSGRKHVDADGNIISLVGNITDISERKCAEEGRIKLEQQLLHAQKLESLGVLAGGIAHDFNNILTAIIGNADLALMRINKESPAVDNLHRIESAAARAADLAKQMLAYSGKGKFIVEALDLNILLVEMLHMLEVSISKKALLRFNPHKHLPAVEADATQMRQIVMNLVINASESIGDKSGVIAITTGCMDCDRSYLKDVWLDENLTDGLYVYLEIADTGCGMDRETMAKLFDPFFTTKFTGRGLGMAAVLGIVRGHKGAIKVYSEPGKGTSFKILIPASGRPAELFNCASHEDEWRGSGTVLLVDDEETVRGIGTEMLKELGFTTVTADDGREAVKAFNATPDIACVIMDLTMPHMDGEQCFRALRQLKPDVKVVMSSGYNEQEVTEKFVGKGLSGFIQKPYRLSTLRKVLEAVFQKP